MSIAARLAVTAGLAAVSAHASGVGVVPSDALARALSAGDCATHASCSHGKLPPALEEAVRRREAAGAPMTYRAQVIRHLTYSPMCYPATLTADEWQAIIDQWGALPPTLVGPGGAPDFNVDSSAAWVGDGGQGPASRAQRARLTYSFPADGTTWGLAAVSTTGPNDLNARHTAQFGAGNVDRGREYYRQALAAWRRYGGLDYQEVADSGIAMDQVTTRRATVGDIRIGGRPFGTSSFLAYNAFPSAAFAGVGGGDMCVNTSFYISTAYNSTANRYRYLRNTMAHEHGHGTGMIHQVPCNGTKLMEPQIAVGFDVLSVDDRRAAGRNYGDRFSGNQSAATARDLGDLTAQSAIERDLSTNGTTGFGNTNQDWFRFTITATRTIVITADPTGGTYTTGQQSSGCNGTTASRVADQAGNLNIELRDSAGVTVLQTAASAAAGANEVLTANNLPAGTYTVRVFDVGPNSTTNQIVQLYDLSVVSNNQTAPPYANAGLNKRCQANTNCWFIGDVNSAPTQPGATIPLPGGYDWDLDGDGVFETLDNPEPFRQYVSNGVYNVTLRVTDSNGRSRTDTITVTVFGATTTLTGVAPLSGQVGSVVPVTITGTNLKNLTSAGMVTVSGAGVTVGGAPVPNALGTSVTGLTFTIAPGAALGARSVTVSNLDGNATRPDAFTITAPACRPDFNNDGELTFDDIQLFVTAYNAQQPSADFNNDGEWTFDDIQAFISEYNAGC